MPPDFLFLLPPAGIFLFLLAWLGLMAALLHWLFGRAWLKRPCESFADVSPVIVTISGTLFGLSVTFLANSVWITQDAARETVNSEARAIRVMENYISSTSATSQQGLHDLIASYGQAVAAEWNGMAAVGASPAAEAALRDVYAAVIQGFTEGEQNRVLQQRLLAALDSVSTSRQQRLSMAQNIVSGGQWVLVIGLGLLLLFMTAATHARAPRPRKRALAAVTVAVSTTLFVIIKHDRPFVGQAALTPTPILIATGAKS